MFDRDGNGFISKQELGTAMRSLGYMPNEVELEVIIQRLDMDGEHPPASVSPPGTWALEVGQGLGLGPELLRLHPNWVSCSPDSHPQSPWQVAARAGPISQPGELRPER